MSSLLLNILMLMLSPSVFPSGSAGWAPFNLISYIMLVISSPTFKSFLFITNSLSCIIIVSSSFNFASSLFYMNLAACFWLPHITILYHSLSNSFFICQYSVSIPVFILPTYRSNIVKLHFFTYQHSQFHT